MTPVLHVSQRFPASRHVRGAGAAAGAASAHRQPRDRVRPGPGSGRRCCGSSPTTSPTACTRRPPTCPRASSASRSRKSTSTAARPWSPGTTCARPTSSAWASIRPRPSAAPRGCARPARPWPRKCARCSPANARASAGRCRCLALRRFHRRRRQAPVRARPHDAAGRRWAQRDVRLPRSAPARTAVPLSRAQLAARRSRPTSATRWNDYRRRRLCTRIRPVRIQLRTLPRRDRRAARQRMPPMPASRRCSTRCEAWGRRDRASLN